MAASAAAAPPVVLVQEPAPAGTARSSVLTLINSAVGAGVLSFGFAFRCTGWAAGLLLTLFVAAVEASTLYVLSRYAERSGTKTYSALVRACAPAFSAR
jgi:sodium-coupled neutral amino acid transporter 7/8